MRFFFLLIAVVAAAELRAQVFAPDYSLTLPDSLVHARPARVDLDNDGLLDVLLLTEVASGATYLQVVKGDTTATPFLAWQATPMTGRYASHAITDYDHDNRMDVLVSFQDGRVAAYLNRGAFAFAEHFLNAPAFTALLLADLDADGTREWISSDANGPAFKLLIMRQTGAFNWQLHSDSIPVRALSLGLADVNLDGRMDLLVSGQAARDSVVSLIYENRGALIFRPRQSFALAGSSSSADVNADGAFDFVVMGTQGVTTLLRSNDDNYAASNLPIALREGRAFLADFDADGAVDYNFQGLLATDTLHVVQYSSGQASDTLDTRGYRSHIFGDEDRDGDLDLIVVARTSRLSLTSYVNRGAINRAPSQPKKPIAVSVFNRQLLYWELSSDDHSPAQSLTYDLYLEGTRTLAAEFDLLNEKRLSVTHGNNGTHHFKLLSRPVQQYAVQAIDQAFHAGIAGICTGGSICAATEPIALAMCEGQPATLQAPREVLWFSFSRGFLGKGGAMNVDISSDTVFYFDPATPGCDALKVWTVSPSMIQDRVIADHYVCKGQSIELSADPGWTTVSWRSHLKGALGSGRKINYVADFAPAPMDTVIATTSKGACTLRDRYLVRLSTPDVRITPDQVRIMRGTSVQLVASGAIRYEWQPSTGLSSDKVPDPAAAPTTNTTYVVTGYDSIGCADTAQAEVFVESGGFIPNLFTPNSDGKNDEIRIYGLTSATGFVFTIENREGSLVYRSEDLQEVMARGWDGTRHGTRQPAGVYFWRVRGMLLSGERLLLNGKDSGSIVLVR